MKRVAYKVSVNDLLEGQLNEGTESEPSYVLVRGKNVSSANVIGTVIAKYEDENSLLIDDASGTIRVRGFGTENKQTSTIDIGQIMQVIGRIRSYGQERYISPDVISFTTAKMMKLRSLELEKESLTSGDSAVAVEEQAIIEEDLSGPMKIREIIREIDGVNEGKGAAIEEIAIRSGMRNAEDVIRSLLEMGEVFEIKPGRLKVME